MNCKIYAYFMCDMICRYEHEIYTGCAVKKNRQLLKFYSSDIYSFSPVKLMF